MKFLLSLLFIQGLLWAQTHLEYVYKNPLDSTYNCYLKVYPEKTPLKGLIIRDYTHLPDATKKSPFKFTDLAVKNGFMVLYTSTSPVFPELFLSDEAAFLLDEMVNEVVVEHKIPKGKVFMGGFSASGARALRFVQFCEQGKSKYDLQLAGAFSVDSPLDMARFYKSSKHIIHRNADNGMLWEANLMIELLDSALGGSPDKFPENYKISSVYSYSSPDGGNAKYLMNTPLLFYHEPDLDWWLEERSATLYDINSFDIVALVGQLRLDGHADVQLVTTTGKGFDRNGKRKPHSWTIVDEQQLIEWIIGHCND